MNKKLMAAVAGVMALTMSLGLVAFAASSPSTITADTTSSSSSSSSSSTTTTVSPSSYVVARNSTSNVAAAPVIGGTTRVVSDYREVTNPSVIFTAIAPKTGDGAAAALTTATAGSTAVSKQVKIQCYIGANSVLSGFGTFNARISVGTRYNGQTVYANVITPDGVISKLPVVVTGGYAIVPMTQVGTVVITLN